MFVIDSQDPERLDELNYDVVKPAVGSEELTSAVFLFLANKMDLPSTMTTDQIADRLGLRFLKHPWGKWMMSLGSITIKLHRSRILPLTLIVLQWLLNLHQRKCYVGSRRRII